MFNELIQKYVTGKKNKEKKKVAAPVSMVTLGWTRHAIITISSLHKI